MFFVEAVNCLAEKKAGPCFGYFPKWFFNQTSNKCTEFIYGGCQGNGNNFESKEECKKKCLVHFRKSESKVFNFPLSIQCDGAWVVAAHRVVMVTFRACLRLPHRPYSHLHTHLLVMSLRRNSCSIVVSWKTFLEFFWSDINFHLSGMLLKITVRVVGTILIWNPPQDYGSFITGIFYEHKRSKCLNIGGGKKGIFELYSNLTRDSNMIEAQTWLVL